MSPAVIKNIMESTVRIDYSSSPASPVIKIITPKHLQEDSDPKDRLVEDFLYTACVADRNQLFYLANAFDLESQFKLSIIAPLGYFTELEKLRSHIERRVMTFETKCECHEFYDNQKQRIPQDSDAKMATKCPADYTTYIKIREFFDWVGEQPYIEKGK